MNYYFGGSVLYRWDLRSLLGLWPPPFGSVGLKLFALGRTFLRWGPGSRAPPLGFVSLPKSSFGRSPMENYMEQ